MSSAGGGSSSGGKGASTGGSAGTDASLRDASQGSPSGDAATCASDNDCSMLFMRCDLTTSKCVGCTTDADCYGGMHCNAQQTCVQCITNADCSSDASTPSICDTSTNRCVQTCATEDDCASASAYAGHCNTGTQRCVQCTTNAHCERDGGFFANFKLCSSNNACVQCLSDSDCPAETEHCNTQTNVCYQCSADTDCSGSTPYCSTFDGVCHECVQDSQCVGKKNDAGEDTPRCSQNGWVCKLPREAGAPDSSGGVRDANAPD